MVVHGLCLSLALCPCLDGVVVVLPVVRGAGCVVVAVSLLGGSDQSVTGCLWIWVCLCRRVPVRLLSSECHWLPVDLGVSVWLCPCLAAVLRLSPVPCGSNLRRHIVEYLFKHSDAR